MKNSEWKQSYILYYSVFLLNIISYFVLNCIMKLWSQKISLWYVKIELIGMFTILGFIVLMLIYVSRCRYYGKNMLLIGVGIEIIIALMILFSFSFFSLIIIVILNSLASIIINVSAYIEISKIAIREKQHSKVVLTLFMFSALSLIFSASIDYLGFFIHIKIWVISTVLLILAILNYYFIARVFPTENFRFLFRHRRIWFSKSLSPSLRGVMMTAFCMMIIASFVVQIYLRWMPNYLGILYNAPFLQIKFTTAYFYCAIIMSLLVTRKIVRYFEPTKVLLFMQMGLVITVLIMELFLRVVFFSPSYYFHYLWQFNLIVIAVGYFIGSSIPLIISTALTAYKLQQQYIVSAVLVFGFIIGSILGRSIFEDFIGVPMITSILAPVVILFLLVVYYEYLRKLQVKRIKSHE